MQIVSRRRLEAVPEVERARLARAAHGRAAHGSRICLLPPPSASSRRAAGTTRCRTPAPTRRPRAARAARPGSDAAACPCGHAASLPRARPTRPSARDSRRPAPAQPSTTTYVRAEPAPAAPRARSRSHASSDASPERKPARTCSRPEQLGVAEARHLRRTWPAEQLDQRGVGLRRPIQRLRERRPVLLGEHELRPIREQPRSALPAALDQELRQATRPPRQPPGGTGRRRARRRAGSRAGSSVRPCLSVRTMYARTSQATTCRSSPDRPPVTGRRDYGEGGIRTRDGV